MREYTAYTTAQQKLIQSRSKQLFSELWAELKTHASSGLPRIGLEM